MSILGVKKKHVDTTEIEKEILNMKSELLTMDTKDKNLYLRVLNVENIVTNIRNMPDRGTINIFAGISGEVQNGQIFYFGNGGSHYVMNFPGQILGIGLTSFKQNSDDVSVTVMVNSDTKNSYGIALGNEEEKVFYRAIHSFSKYVNFDIPLQVEAGDRISFISKSKNTGCINTLVSAVIELFL